MKKEETNNSLTANSNTPVENKTTKTPKKSKSTYRKVWIWSAVAYAVVLVCIGVVLITSIQKTHEHNFSEDYKTDETYHWKYCVGCDEIAEKGEHVYDGCLDATCNVCGYERGVLGHVYDDCLDKSCNVCGYIRTAGHIFENYVSDETNHWKVCKNCDATTTAEAHTFEDEYATDGTHHWKVCSVCGKTTAKVEHVYDDCLDESCNVCGYVRTAGHIFENYVSDETNHWKICKNCDATTTAEAHTFDSGKCTVCDYIQVTEGLTYNYDSETNGYAVRANQDIQTSLKYIRIPETYNDGTHGELPVTKLNAWAFSNDPLDYEIVLEGVVIPESVTYISFLAFGHCYNLKEVTIPKNVTTMAAAFYYCTGLTEVTILGDLSKTSYGGGESFKGCTSLKKVTFSENAKNIPDYLFPECTGLTEVNLPAGLISLNGLAFAGCPIENLTMAGESSVYHLENGCLIETATKKLVLGTNNAVIPTDGSVEIIGEYAFSGRTGKLTKVVNNTTEMSLPIINIPEGIKTIEAYAFYSILEDSGFGVLVPKSVQSLSENTFTMAAGDIMIFYAGSVEDFEYLFASLEGEDDDLGEQSVSQTDSQSDQQTSEQGNLQSSKQGDQQTNPQTSTGEGSGVDTSKTANDSGAIDETGVTSEESNTKSTTWTELYLFYSETKPTETEFGVYWYWHYVDGVITVWAIPS